MAYTGQIAEIIVGTDGLTGTKNQAIIKPTQLLLANNITFDSGTMRKEGGKTAFNSSSIGASVSILGGYDWIPLAGIQRSILYGSDGKIYRAADSTYSAITTGLTIADDPPVFVEGGGEVAASNNKLFIFTGKNVVQVIDGDSSVTANITTPPADWASTNQPVFGLVHEGTLWGGGNTSDPHRMYYSKITDHEDFSDNNSLSIFPGEGEKLIGALSYKGLLICWKKPKGVYVIDTTDPASANWKIARISDAVGAASSQSMVLVDNDIVFMDPAGVFHALSAVLEFGNISQKSISDIADLSPLIREMINLGSTNKTYAVYYPAKREVHFSTPGLGSTSNTVRIVLDLSTLNKPKFRISDRDTAIALWLKKDSDDIPRLTMGSTNGIVYDMDTENRSDNGSGYIGEFQTPHMDLGHLDPSLAAKLKNFDFLELLVEPSGNWNLSVDVIIDGDTTQTIQFDMGTSGATLGSFILAGTDASDVVHEGDKLSESLILNKKKRILGSGSRISFKGANSGDGEDFSVAKFLLHFRIAGETAGT